MSAVEVLAQQLSLGDFLAGVRALGGDVEILWHHTQGEFHHDSAGEPGKAGPTQLCRVRFADHSCSDLAVRVPEGRSLPRVLVAATNCNGGVKEVLAFDEPPTPEALWHHRCPDNPEFVPRVALPAIRDRATTIHFFDPCELLRQDARSELREEHRARQAGGGWCMAPERK
jgi:hypothetical protein